MMERTALLDWIYNSATLTFQRRAMLTHEHYRSSKLQNPLQLRNTATSQGLLKQSANRERDHGEWGGEEKDLCL